MNDGARVSIGEVRDTRVTTAIAWCGGIFATAMVLIGSWIATSITSLNTNVTRLVVLTEGLTSRQDKSDTRDDRQDDKIIDLQRDVSTINGKNLRGGPHSGAPYGK